jgi:hypothetical protein
LAVCFSALKRRKKLIITQNTSMINDNRLKVTARDTRIEIAPMALKAL